MSSRYILRDVIGRGGMGVVYEATDRLTSDTVAYKQVTVPPAALRGSTRPLSETILDLRLALANEFRLLSSLRHPNIISVLDYGFDQMGQPFYTMAYLEENRAFTELPNTYSLEQRLDLLRQLLQAMVYLHHRGVLHRDLKPANVLVNDDRVRVLDFGLAALKGQEGSSVGSWSYVAPELIYGKAASESSDLYSIGVMAYELFAQHHPFDVESPFFMEQILSEPPSFTDVEAPADICNFIDRMLSKEPTGRFANAAEALRVLNEITQRHSEFENDAIRDSFLQAANFVGRQLEMAQFVDALEKARNGQGSFWLLGGESGVGKTRLLDEIRNRALVEGALVCSGQAQEDKGRPYQLWQRVIQRLALNIELDEVSAGVLQTIVPNLEQIIGQPIPEPPPLETEAAKQRLISVVSDLFVHQQGWLLLILEDLQWAHESLEILSQLARLSSTMPLLIIGSYRYEDRPELPEKFPEAETILLNRFSADEAAKLSQAMLGNVGSQQNILALLQRETEGNPFFIVEVLRALADQAGNLNAIGQLTLPEKMFPERIATIMQRRLAKLPKYSRQLLPAAAVIGRELDLDLLALVAPRLGIRVNLERWLSQCADVYVLEISDDTWRFAHDKIRHGVLDDLDEATRLRSHQEVAAAIEELYPDQPAYAAQLADHWQVIGDRQRELHYASIAGHYAAGQFAHEIALRYLNRAIDLVGEEDLAQLYDLLLTREGIYSLRGERDNQTADIVRLSEVASKLSADGPTERLPQSALRMAQFAETTGDYDAAVAAATEAHRLANDIGSGELAAASQLALGQAYIRKGNYDAALAALQRSMKGAQATRSTQIEAHSHRFMGVAALEQGQLDDGTTRFRQALSLYRIIDDKQGESTVLSNLGITKVKDSIAEALIYWKQASTIFQEIGDRLGLARVLTNLATIYSDLGEYATAISYGQQALQLCTEINVPLGVCFSLHNLSLTEMHLGNIERAESLNGQTIRKLQEIGARWLEAASLNARGYILSHQERLPEAYAAWEQSLAVATELQQESLIFEVKAEMALAAEQLGDAESSRHYLEDVIKVLDDPKILDAATTPFRLQLVTIRLLRQIEDPRANLVLQGAYARLQEKAGKISNEDLRLTFLTRVNAHRAIIELYEKAFAE